MGVLGNGTFKDGGVTHKGGGVFTPLQTKKYLIQNDHLIDRGVKYFRAEAINTNGNT